MTKPSLLIIEDEPMIAFLLEDFLEEAGHRVAGNPASLGAALAAIEAGGFDGAILDVNLGNEQSWPAAEALRAQGIPFVIASGGGAEAFPEAYRAVPVLSKPFTLTSLESAIKALFPDD